MREDALDGRMPPAPNRWVVVALLSASTFLNYIDRQILALLAQPIQHELAMDDKGYAFVVSAFMVAYMAGNLVSGWMVDRGGARWAMAFFVTWWSVASCLSGLAQDTHQLAATRFALGLAEVGNFIAAPVLVAIYFPPSQRALGIGIYTAAAMFGAALSPPLITGLAAATGWRPAFLITGGIGLLWTAAWLGCVKGGAAAPLPTGGAAKAGQGAIDLPTWWDALRTRQVWGIALGITLTWPVWYFYLNWFPKYLVDERGLSTLEMGAKAWIVYLAAGIGCLVGGSASGLLARYGLRPRTAKLWVLGAVCILAPVGAGNAWGPPVGVSLAFAAAVALLHMFWQVNLTALPTDLFTSRSISKVMALSGIASGVAGIGTTWLIGQLVGQISYRPMFALMAVVYALGFLAILWLCGRGGKGE
ncbi:MFS transporter [Niveispirillum sp. KHB5.9]|uniref:MFS transporter n=1 Tax=Niveispirillum sp. KHB5.9 TaxID=3400269 RepID=UPI003A86017D